MAGEREKPVIFNNITEPTNPELHPTSDFFYMIKFTYLFKRQIELVFLLFVAKAPNQNLDSIIRQWRVTEEV